MLMHIKRSCLTGNPARQPDRTSPVRVTMGIEKQSYDTHAAEKVSVAFMVPEEIVKKTQGLCAHG